MKATSPMCVAIDCANGLLSKKLAISVLVKIFGFKKTDAIKYLE